METIKKREDIINEMVLDNNYINWLMNYTEGDTVFCINEVTLDDKYLLEINANKLGFLYSIISEYADNNGIYPRPCGYGIYYKIRIGNTGFDIGKTVVPSISYYCNREQVTNKEDYIDYNDIYNYYKNKHNARVMK